MLATRRYLASWAGAIFLFFTASSAKLPHYILPVIPPLAILVAVYADSRSAKPSRWMVGAGLAFMAAHAIADLQHVDWGAWAWAMTPFLAFLSNLTKKYFQNTDWS